MEEINTSKQNLIDSDIEYYSDFNNPKSSKLKHINRKISDIISNNEFQISDYIVTKEDFYSNNNMIYIISEYDPICEEHFKIKYIIPLDYSYFKLFFYVIFNILTLFTINLFLYWFPNLQLLFVYKYTCLSKAKFIKILGFDEENYIIPLKRIKLPDISNSLLVKEYKNNLNYNDNEIIYFSFKLFKYIYNEESCTFLYIKNELDITYKNILTKLSYGLDSTEIEYQKKLYGICDIDIEVKSFFKILIIEFTDPFYLFQVVSIILWLSNEYILYASVIIISTLISLLESTFETRENLLNVKEMARYKCDINVYRKNNNNESVYKNISSVDLVPGDIFEIPNEGFALPCDCILLEGTVIVNEAMLTGESTPIIKNHIQRLDEKFNSEYEKKNLLFAGTKIIQKRTKGKKVIALVYKTGFNTKKGNLIRSILYPKRLDIKFKQDSIKYIYLMSILSFTGFVISIPFLLKTGSTKFQIFKKSLDLITTTVPPSLPACLGIGISYAINRLKNYGILCIDRDRVNIAGKVDIIVFDKTGTLTEDYLDIYGYRPIKLTKNDVFEFDNFIKDIKPFSEKAYIHYKNKKLKNEKNKNLDLNQFFIECLASCHTCCIINNKLIGDSIDVKMFESSNWDLIESSNQNNLDKTDTIISTYLRPKKEIDLQNALNNNNSDENDEEIESIIKSHYELGVIRQFEFESKLQRMSVLTKDVNDDYYKLFCKGSPEKIKELCQEKTIPLNFNEILKKYTSKGYRVLALSFKLIKMNYLQTQKIKRENVENNLIFLGLLIVQNKLKTATKFIIDDLDKTGIKMVMATGDNLLTAISVGKECGIINNESVCFSCNIEKKELLWNTIEYFSDSEEESSELNSFKYISSNEKEVKNIQKINFNKAQNKSKDNIHNFSLKNKLSSSFTNSFTSFTGKFPPEKLLKKLSNDDTIEELESEQNSILNNSDNSLLIGLEVKNYPFKSQKENEDSIIAIEGKTFEYIYNLSNKYLENYEEKYYIYYDIYKNILKHGYIFARMSPENKSTLVQSFKNKKFTVLMCGDGANDCSALRAANVGVSLSIEEASIAAHFTSNVSDISCLIKLLREGKSSLITCIQTFKYMIIYSLVQFISVTLLMIVGSYLSDYQFLAVDGFIIFPLAFSLPRTEPYQKLSKHHPTDALISFPVIVSILSQCLIAFIFQFISIKLLYDNKEKWYKKCELTFNDDVIECPGNTVIFLISNIQYLITASVYIISKPFKKPFYTNWVLTFFLITSLLYSFKLIINPDYYSRYFLQIYDWKEKEGNIKMYLVIICISNFIISYISEKIILPILIKYWNIYKHKKNKENKNKDIEYTLNELQIINEE